MFKKLLSIALLLVCSSLLFAQTCNPNIIETTPTARFTPNNDGTVLDTKTGLVWKVCSEGQIWASDPTCTGISNTYSWKTALDAVQTLNAAGGFAGQSDWRLPNIKELASIIELKCYFPAINLTIFPNTLSSFVWSSSPIVTPQYGAWFVDFNKGIGSSNNKNGVNLHARLVRGG